MKTRVHEISGTTITELVSDSIVIQNSQDALDMMATATYEGSQHLIWHEHQLNPEFFDLKTGLAGEILQKVSNYKIKLAIVANTKKFQRHSLNAFVIECNRGNQVFFCTDLNTALAKLTA